MLTRYVHSDFGGLVHTHELLIILVINPDQLLTPGPFCAQLETGNHVVNHLRAHRLLHQFAFVSGVLGVLNN